MNSKLIAAAVAATLLAPAAVSAQDAEQWQGFYAGVSISQSDAEFSTSPVFDANGDMVLGLQAGYNHAIGPNWVIGAEVAHQAGDTVVPSTPGFFGVGPTTSFRVRGGFAFNSALFYAGVGAVSSEAFVVGFAQDMNGTQMFVGAEVLLSDRVSARIEYGTTTFDAPVALFGPGQDIEVDTLSVGVNYRF